MKKIDAFWDSSALVPLCVDQGTTALARTALRSRTITVWWGTPVEIKGAFCRLSRSGNITRENFVAALSRLALLEDNWVEVLPSPRVRALAEIMLERRALRAADALQLAAAVVWSADQHGRPFICFDDLLADAARREGFLVETP